MASQLLVTTDPWQSLRIATSARIALGRAGGSLPTSEWLNFKGAHAAARDAVHNPFNAESFAAQIHGLGHAMIVVETEATDRMIYLQRPDFGRRLSDASRQKLELVASANSPTDLAIVISDGLSALAVERHAAPLLAALLSKLKASRWLLAPIVVARFGRVALQDEVGEMLGAQIALMLIGERPGLGSPDSLGAYLVFAPRIGNTDANRNCVSNVRPEGLPYEPAAETLYYLLSESRRLRLSGVSLKDQRRLAVHSPGPTPHLGRND
jgi:ethanolamine ammonia-lyase small subunit